MLNDDQIDWALLARYVAGECSSAEAAEIERWLAADPGRQDELADLRRLWDQAGALPSGSRIDAMWQELKDRMGGAGETRLSERPALLVLPNRVSPSARRLRLVAGVAAVVALAVGGAAIWKTGREVPATVTPATLEREFSTAPGQRAEITLPDGSHVELGVASKLTVRLAGGGPREVHLDGEAVFDVIHDALRPFLVYSGNAVTEDLGTRFAIRAYESDSEVRVVVVSGRVALRLAQGPAGGTSDSAGALLGPNDLGRLDADGRTRIVRLIDTAPYLAWTAGRLVFRQATLHEVAVELSRWYGIPIEIPSASIAGKRVTLDMPVQGLQDVLKAVTVPLNLRYTTTTRGVVLHP